MARSGELVALCARHGPQYGDTVSLPDRRDYAALTNVFAGVMAYVVSQRTHELGIRLALGASAGHVTQQVLGPGLRLVLVGLGLGGLGALALSRSLASSHPGHTTAQIAVRNRVFLLGSRSGTSWAASFRATFGCRATFGLRAD